MKIKKGGEHMGKEETKIGVKIEDHRMTFDDFANQIQLDFADEIRTKIAELGKTNFEAKKPLVQENAYNDALIDVLEYIKERLCE